MQRTIIPRLGEVLITDKNEPLNLDQTPIRLGDVELAAETMTNLNGFYNRPIKYVGRKDKKLYFYIGDDDSDLFKEAKSYYEIIRHLTEKRFFKLYTHKGGRDYNFKNGRWK